MCFPQLALPSTICNWKCASGHSGALSWMALRSPLAMQTLQHRRRQKEILQVYVLVGSDCLALTFCRKMCKQWLHHQKHDHSCQNGRRWIHNLRLQWPWAQGCETLYNYKSMNQSRVAAKWPHAFRLQHPNNEEIAIWFQTCLQFQSIQQLLLGTGIELKKYSLNNKCM